MKISIHQLRLHNLVFNCIFLISLSQTSVAGLELLFDGRKFFYRSNGKDTPVELSPGTEIARYQEELNYPSYRKTRETVQILDPDPMNNDNGEESGSWSTCENRSIQPVTDLGTDIVENQLGGMVVEEVEENYPTRYDLIASLTNSIDIEKPEDRIDAIISLIREDLERHFKNNQELNL